MRVSDAQVYASNQTNLMSARSRYAEASEKASSGRRVRKPSDDPTAFAQAARHADQHQRAVNYQRAIDKGVSHLQRADSVLDEAGAAMVRIRELAVQLANDTYGPLERQMAAEEVRELRQAMISYANTEMAGSYIFAGYADDAPPFDATGTYIGSANTRELEVAPGLRVEEGLTGEEIFGAAGGLDIFAAIETFENALLTNDVAQVRASIGDMSDATDQISDARGALGARMTAMYSAQAVNERVEVEAADRYQGLIAIDPAEAYSSLAQAQYVLQSAVQIASQLPMPGLAGG